MTEEEQPDPQAPNPTFNMNGAGARDFRPGKFYGRPGRSIAKYLEIFRSIAHAKYWQDAKGFRILSCYLMVPPPIFYTIERYSSFILKILGKDYLPI